MRLLYEQYFGLRHGAVEHKAYLVHLLFRKSAQQIDSRLEVAMHGALLQVADQLRDALPEAGFHGVAGPPKLGALRNDGNEIPRWAT